MSELVEKLTQGKHQITVEEHSERPLEDLRDSIEREFVHVKFTETKGGTELGFRLEKEATDLSNGDLQQGTGTIRLAGRITLDYVPVRVVADVELANMAGQGYLEVLDEQ